MGLGNTSLSDRRRLLMVKALVLSALAMGILLGIYFHEGLRLAHVVVWLVFIGSASAVLILSELVNSARRFEKLTREADRSIYVAGSARSREA